MPSPNTPIPLENQPLAYRMTPRTLQEFVGQEAFLAPGKLLYRMIKADRLSSLIFFGPPGCGKSSLARLIAQQTKKDFVQLNAVTAGVADIKEVIARTASPLLCPSGQILLFLDEIHRFNKAQQDLLLPYTEEGRIILVGSTTENPFFEVNKALLSRATIFPFEPLTADSIEALLIRALEDPDRGLGKFQVVWDKEAIRTLAESTGGDARIALNTLELAVLSSGPDSEGKIHLDAQTIQESLSVKPVRYDKKGDVHYENISAMIKSMRASAPDAAIFYMAQALVAGEDPLFLARRIVICAAEDVGLANPHVLSVCQSAYEACERIGMPEARIILAEAILLVATSPKSNAGYLAINEAMAASKTGKYQDTPKSLINPVYEGMKDLGYGVGYQYPHDFPDHLTDPNLLPASLAGTSFYRPTSYGHEAQIKKWLADRAKKFADLQKKQGEGAGTGESAETGDSQ